jgi:hypothetical protein
MLFRERFKSITDEFACNDQLTNSVQLRTTQMLTMTQKLEVFYKNSQCINFGVEKYLHNVKHRQTFRKLIKLKTSPCT